VSNIPGEIMFLNSCAATRKRSAAMLQEERASSEEEGSSPAPSRPVSRASRARKLPRLNSVADILNHNASGDEEGGLLSRVDAGCDSEEEEEEEDMDAVASGGEGEKDEGDGEQVSACGKKKKKKSVMEDQEVSDSAI
jgi:hypothetical protein